MNLIIHTGIYLPHFMYVLHIRKNRPVRSENLTSELGTRMVDIGINA